ncbi:MAG: hypothetical protein PHU81_07435 [Acidobacteriota bacterium]|nr:hypothetical protein [Acidobacteriota bacterium]
MKKIIPFAVLFLGIMLSYSLAQVETVLEKPVPPGWKYKAFSISSSKAKALSFLQDVPDLVLLTQHLPRRFQFFSSDNTLTADFFLEDNYYLGHMTKDNKVILVDSDGGDCYRLKALDISGKELYVVDTEGRWPCPSPDGKDIALIPGPSQIGPVSIIDSHTGREKAIIDLPAMKDKSVKIGTLLPLGEGGLYVIGIGATLCLKSYSEPNKTYWQIQDIGGNIDKSFFLDDQDDQYIAVGYRLDDFKEHKFMAGVAVVEWKSGNILFNKRGFQVNGRQDEWYALLNSMSISISNGDLMLGKDPENLICFPRLSGQKKGWGHNHAVKFRINPEQTKEININGKVIKPEVHAAKYIVVDYGDRIRIEKCRYVKIPEGKN